MSLNLEAAFNTMIQFASGGVKATLKDLDSSTTAEVMVAKSNYFRNFSGPEEITFKGREYVVSKKMLDAAGFPIPKRGHKISHPDLGNGTISESDPMIVMGQVLGYRIRTG